MGCAEWFGLRVLSLCVFSPSISVPLLLQPPPITERGSSSSSGTDGNKDRIFSPAQTRYESETRGSSLDGRSDALPEAFRMSSLLDEFPQVGQFPPVPVTTIQEPRTPPRSPGRIRTSYDIMEVPIDQVMTSEEKMSKFWESLDAEAYEEKPARKTLSYADAVAAYCSKPRLLRKPKSVNALDQNRLSAASLATISTKSQGNLRKRFLSRPRSRPLSFKLAKQYDVQELPKGVEQIGNGIGFIRDKHAPAVDDRFSGELSTDGSTPTIATSCSKASVCAPQTPRLMHQRSRYGSFFKSLPQISLGFVNPWRRGKPYGTQEQLARAGSEEERLEETKVPKLKRFKSRSKFRSFSGPVPASALASTTDLTTSTQTRETKDKKRIRSRQSMPTLSESTPRSEYDGNHDPAAFIRQIYGSNSNLSLGLLMSPSSTLVVSPSMALSPLADSGPFSPEMETVGSLVGQLVGHGRQEKGGVEMIGEPRSLNEMEEGIGMLDMPHGPAKEAREGDPKSTLRLVKPVRPRSLGISI
ncbi:hypothetical protein BDN72DRAFT_417252 [Pluteus cervinus]|uniref:Uncharacterized protein n=1 Tax=Pluteus cervinus TaxID=181527 RepID=A0ACD3B0U7_9AGAR|nr:hypothetical protein BDN72DRAFT_417252 [Pluteus cervinus]